jgi:hypothetical protein
MFLYLRNKRYWLGVIPGDRPCQGELPLRKTKALDRGFAAIFLPIWLSAHYLLEK